MINFTKLKSVGTIFYGCVLGISFGAVVTIFVKASWPQQNGYFVFCVAVVIAFSLWMMMNQHSDELARKLKAEDEEAAREKNAAATEETAQHPHWP
jgi:cobalamin biosynthesis protein CobD/CbiB